MRAFIVVLAMLFTPLALADELQPVYIQLDEVEDQQWSIMWKASARSSLGRSASLMLPNNCTQTTPTETLAVRNNIRRTLSMTCSGSLGGQSIGLNGLENTQSDALVRVAPLESGLLTLRLTPSATSALIVIAEPQTSTEVALTYTSIGVEHIVFGFDHLLFVLSLVLLLSNMRTLFWAITAFTLAHSVTLVGTTLGYFGLASQPVEAVIALSIMFLAIEIIKSKPGEQRLSERFPWMVAFSFGLLHGFGFAGALSEIGLPSTDRPLALLGFNIGVELGQLFVVAMGLVILALARRLISDHRLVLKIVPAYLIGIIATYWFLERTLLV